jgi:peptidoglycan/xylan/chitin deacetylase (PgdA/CDA1 family)
MPRSWLSRFALSVAGLIAAIAPLTAQQLAFTWDDLPAHGPLPPGVTRVEIARQLIDAMKTAHLPPVYGFINGIQTEHEPDSTPMLKMWRDAGFPLGNHTWSHSNLNTVSLADWEADVLRNEPLLKQYAAGSDWHWLRYPYLAEGDTPQKREQARQFLAAHGYKIAAVTMSFGDYMWNEPYARCVAKNDSASIEQLESSYLAAAAADADYSRATAKTLFGHDIPYVLLMHVGAFDARMLPRLLAVYRDKSFSFVRLEEAEKDPFYASSADPSLAPGTDMLASARGVKPPKPAIDLQNLCR